MKVFDLAVPDEELLKWARLRARVSGKSVAVRARPTG